MFSLQIFLNTFCRGVVVAPTAILPTTDWRTAVRKQVCVVTSNKTHAVRVVNRMSSGETVSSCISCPSKLSMIQYVSTIVTFLFQNFIVICNIQASSRKAVDIRFLSCNFDDFLQYSRST